MNITLVILAYIACPWVWNCSASLEYLPLPCNALQSLAACPTIIKGGLAHSPADFPQRQNVIVTKCHWHGAFDSNNYLLYRQCRFNRTWKNLPSNTTYWPVSLPSLCRLGEFVYPWPGRYGYSKYLFPFRWNQSPDNWILSMASTCLMWRHIPEGTSYISFYHGAIFHAH